MTGHTANGYPYALPTDALIDYPAASLELATKLEAPRCKVTRNAALTIPTSVMTDLPWDSDTGVGLYDTDNLWAPAAPTLIVARTAGIYLFSATVSWGPTAVAGFRQYMFAHTLTGRVFGSMITPSAPVGVPTAQTLQAIIPMNVNDSVVFRVAHNDSPNALSLGVDATSLAVILLALGGRVSLGEREGGPEIEPR